MRISDWSSDVCSSDLSCRDCRRTGAPPLAQQRFHSVPAHPWSFPLWAALPCLYRLPALFAAPTQLWAKQCLAQTAVQRKQQDRTEEHTSELQSLMRISYAVFCLKKKK